MDTQFQNGETPSSLKESVLKDSVIDTILQAVNLQNIQRTTINSETVLTQGGLGLDSVDILEVVVAIEHRFGIKLKNPQEGKEHFRTIGTITEFVRSESSKANN